jgi:GAF domain-containing protein
MAMEAEPEFDGARLFAQIAQELAGEDGFGDTADRVAELAAQLTECDTAAIWTLSNDGRPILHAASEPAVAKLQGLVNKKRGGIGWDCLQEKSTLRVNDLRTDPRWPLYRAWLHTQDQPMISAAGYSLQVEDHIVGALVLWSRQPDHFTDHRMNVGAIFAEHAAISLQLATAEDQAKNLREALESNRRIGIALGIIMGQYRVTDQVAFDMLRVASQNSHVKLRDLADEVALTGTLPDLRSLKMA